MIIPAVKIGDVVLLRYGRIVPIAESGTVTGADVPGTIHAIAEDGCVTVRLDEHGTHVVFIRPAAPG